MTAKRDRPNVLVVMSDEQRWDSFGHAGNPAAHTPHLDALAEQSTIFEGCYTPFPLCCPSRASLWTGRMPRHHHVLGNWRAVNPDLRDAGLGRAFQDAGYHTMYCGKWHVPGTTPARMGFADQVAIPAVLDGRDRGRYIEPYREYATAQGFELVEGNIENLTPADVGTLRTAPHRGTAEIPVEHFLETWQTGQFLGALGDAPDDRPWFAVCSFNAPHFPMIVPAPYDTIIDRGRVELPPSFATGPDTRPREVAQSGFARRYADLDEAGWVELVAHYLGLGALVDAQVGAIVEHLRRTGQLERTIVVYTSDHGDLLGAHRLMEKGHLLHYEEALRVPLIIRHPDVGAATSTGNLVSVVDLAATLTELADVARDEDDDGISFAGMLGRRAAAPTRAYVTAETVLYGMNSDARGEYTDPADWNATTDALNVSVRTGTSRYIHRSHDVDELYDHTTDPHEQRNVAADPAYEPERLRLRRVLAEEIEDVFPQVAAELCQPRLDGTPEDRRPSSP
ncbi:Arylsulfatase A [Actinopolymorpha cephalotaxi]|uniref:Arylsulfatase A n=1 Tax=Actinopolymorpha cephalotaxi TaxID=504797 RepID=A0A1I3BB50_9ACTN|nr:sulfatase-like hydrolase/transferase [Actinopolymorpha cephalotaxi]NYH86801.1 arylsulfatase A-like enzyme [Actinopolymorpha cephalotaxi]SFH59179.1 Arylsulfatase A [Actinopolymorpha cephalotaxi]